MNQLVFVDLIIQIIAIPLSLNYTLNIKLDRTKVIIYIVGIALLVYLVFIWTTFWLSAVTFMLAFIVAYYYLTKNSRVLLDVACIMMGAVLLSHLATSISSHLFTQQNLLTFIVFQVLFVLFLLLYGYCYKLVIQKIFSTLFISKLGIFTVFAFFCMTLIVFYVNIILTDKYDQATLVNLNLLIQGTYFIITIALILFLLYTLMKEQQVKQKAIELQQFTQYIDTLEQVNRDMQKFRHDYRNILLTMQEYMHQQDLKGLEAYFQQHIMQTERQTMFKHQVLGRLDQLKVFELKGLLATKVLQADEHGIKVNVDIPTSIDNIQMNIIDLTRIIGIFMDNAIEACQSVKQGTINIAFLEPSENIIIIIIENSFFEGQENMAQLFMEGYSTKGENRGLGLTVARNLVNQYSNATLNTDIDSNWFIQELEIRNEGAQR